MLTEEAIQNGSLSLYEDDDYSIAVEVDEYNKSAEANRYRMKMMKKTVLLLQCISFIYVFILVVISFLRVQKYVSLMLIALALFDFSLYYMCGKKKNLWLHTLLCAPMLLYGLGAIPLLLGSAATANFYHKKDAVLKAEPGYPDFLEVQVHYMGEKRNYYDAPQPKMRGGNGMIIVDRLEGDVAVVESTSDSGEVTMQNMPREWIQGDVQAGDVLVKTHYGYAVDAEATQMRRQAAVQQLHSLAEL